ncbi:fatty acid desaturase [Halobacteriovorax sp. HLS]|uniref:fatty acid desaturase n=1 Tax=Halobacteriovorax sp. HLS TaxID=2234000 RepID=UPI000FDAEBFC|nr:fatty acid desaturase [Halobacteriovorax sp. HLS]
MNTIKKDFYPKKFATRTLALFTMLLSLYIIVSILAYSGLIPLWTAVILNSLLSYGLFTPLHEACHENISASIKKFKLIENLIGYISGYTLLAPFSVLKLQHLRHHSKTNQVGKDPDLFMSSSNVFIAIIKLPIIYLVAYYNIFKQGAYKKRDIFITSNIMNIIFVTSFIILSSKFGYIYPLMIWVLPALGGLAILSMVFAWIPHHPHKQTDKYKNTRIIKGRILNYLMLGQNYHLIHHLYPKIPYYDYKRAFEVDESFLISMKADIT